MQAVFDISNTWEDLEKDFCIPQKPLLMGFFVLSFPHIPEAAELTFIPEKKITRKALSNPEVWHQPW